MDGMWRCLAVAIVILIHVSTYKGSSMAAQMNGVTQGASRCTTRWSQWINTDTPATGGGDKEMWTAQQKAAFCPSGGHITSIQCQTTDGIPSYSSGEIMTCSLDDGSVCLNDDNFPIPCSDYQIRYRCICAAATASQLPTYRSTDIVQTSGGSVTEAPPRSTGNGQTGNEAKFASPIWRLLFVKCFLWCIQYCNVLN